MFDISMSRYTVFDGRMVEEKCNDRGTNEYTVSGSIFDRYGGQTIEPRKIGKYSYRLVHTPESIRMLDMRLDIVELENVENIAELFAQCCRSILTRAIDRELARLGGRGPTELNDQVRYKDS